ncbi:hypothetical protein J6590_001090, partial [Homalodisca vitripennis]
EPIWIVQDRKPTRNVPITAIVTSDFATPVLMDVIRNLILSAEHTEEGRWFHTNLSASRNVLILHFGSQEAKSSVTRKSFVKALGENVLSIYGNNKNEGEEFPSPPITLLLHTDQKLLYFNKKTSGNTFNKRPEFFLLRGGGQSCQPSSIIGGESLDQIPFDRPPLTSGAIGEGRDVSGVVPATTTVTGNSLAFRQLLQPTSARLPHLILA